jgi:hypothetical protein
MLQAGFLFSLYFDPEDGGNIPLKRRLTCNGLHGVISKNRELFSLFYGAVSVRTM